MASRQSPLSVHGQHFIEFRYMYTDTTATKAASHPVGWLYVML